MDLKTLCKDVITLTQQVGDFILLEKSKVKPSQIEIKDLNSLVSYVDKQAEKKLVSNLRELLPQAGFIAEEGTGTENATGYNWIIDPLDGTTNFLFGLPTFAISIALVKDGELLLGVVYELGQKEMFSAVKNQGAALNGEPIRVSANANFNQGLFATGFPYYDFSRVEGFLKLMSYFFTNTRGVRRIGSAATDLAYVACGRFDGFFEYGLSPWDVAAGALLVQEAGGSVTDYQGKNAFIFGGEIAAASAKTHPLMLQKIKEFMAS